MLVGPGIQVKAVEGHPLLADRYVHHTRSNLSIEAVLVHSEVPWRIP
jgi:hypothetical protein